MKFKVDEWVLFCQFPDIKIRWVKGSDLALTYPKGKINYNDRKNNSANFQEIHLRNETFFVSVYLLLKFN